jgi:tRNA(fMet)-specific endonuclease VapC
MSLILDTDHCVAILRGRLQWQGRVTSSTSLLITAVTVSELIFGAHRSERLAENLGLIDELLEIVTILSFDAAAARRHGELKDILRRAGTPLADLDLLIASIALSRGLPLVTHNTAHFARIPGLALMDWLAPQ